MSSVHLLALVGGLLAGGAVAAGVLRRRLNELAPAKVMRTNVNGREVPVILGTPILWGSLGGLACALVVLRLAGALVPLRLAGALCVVLIPLWAAGSWDDSKGDERARGFTGHLGAARRLQLTGGLVKLMVGAAAGLVAGALLAHGAVIVEVGLLVALGANTINLFDRAPGRAGKVALIGLVPLAVLGETRWAVAAGGCVASLVASLPSDLWERAMLGDAGANPVGGVVGLGLAVSLPEVWRVVTIVLLAALNLASERWSFSRGIARIGFLARLDRLGRR
jgi:UDP-GlcNAc:undecaprenyl-phosphate/decaprenyl-phosphate GlcNAc-1-phosphate transferase